MAEAIAIVSVLGTAVILIWALVRLRRSKNILITDFQRGVRFRNGELRDVLEAGSYVFDSVNEQIVVMDLRPRPVLLERLGYQDASHSPSIISIAGELLVTDAHLAATRLKDPVKDTFPTVRDALLGCVKQTITDESSTGRQRIAERIAEAANTELAKVGMRIANIEVTELWSRPMQAGLAAAAN